MLNTMMPDISSILYLALARKSYCNLYRFTMTMNEEVDRNVLQKAADQIHDRFAMLMCGFQSSFFHDVQTFCQKRIQVVEDAQKLKILSKKEIETCPARILVKENQLSIEFFHALTDGYGAVAYISTLTAEYLKLRYDMSIPMGYPVIPILDEVKEEEIRDEYFSCASKTAAKLNRVAAYQLPRDNKKESMIHTAEKVFSLKDLKTVSKSFGVSPTAFLSEIMAESFMQHQLAQKKTLKPVRIMIPVNLRGFYPSTTFRNFIETIHVTFHHEDIQKTRQERLEHFKKEMKSQLNQEHLFGLVKAHVDVQQSLLFKWAPKAIKYFAFKIGYALFGESNSTLTFTNLGVVNLPQEMHPYVQKIDCYLSPRAGSPYNCAMITYQDHVSLNFSSFNHTESIENAVYSRISQILNSSKELQTDFQDNF